MIVQDKVCGLGMGLEFLNDYQEDHFFTKGKECLPDIQPRAF
jgi:hypothetical protein